MSSFEPLPHAYPFRFADRTLEKTGPATGRVRMLVTANARCVAEGVLAPMTLAELVAQAALLLQGGDPELGRSGFLAGFSGFTFDIAPEAGECLEVELRVAGRLGPVVKFEGTIRDGAGRRVASGAVTVRQGAAA